MSRLIDADALIQLLRTIANDDWNKNTPAGTWSNAYEEMILHVEDAPTIAPQRTGRWIPLQLSIAYTPYQCSCCFGNAPMVKVGTGRLKKGYLEALLTEFCPNCGARMEENNESD